MTTNLCPVCHTAIPAGAPGGFCPACVLRGAEETVPASPPGGPSLEEVSAAFPQLEIQALIGMGGMGSVYKVRQPSLDRTVALKILSPVLSRDPAFAERFAREARVLGRLNHPNIVAIFEHGISQASTPGAQPYYYLLMEYVDGVNLRQAMRAGKFTPQQALAVVPGICDALQAAHAQGIWHRDIKPENILLDARGGVKIADFGIARLAGDAQQAFTLTMTGARLGSAAYMAPEQHEKPHEVDHRADIYSLGVVIYEMLTGELPLGRFPAPSARSAVDARIDDIVLRTLEKERELRQQSAAEVKTGVALAGGPRPAIQVSERLAALRRNWRACLAFGFGTTLVAVGNDRSREWPVLVSYGIMALGYMVLGVMLMKLTSQKARESSAAGAITKPSTPRRRNLIGSLAVVVVIVLVVRSFLLQPFRTMTDAAAPEIPQGSLVLVWKPARTFAPGDLIAWEKSGLSHVGRVIRSEGESLIAGTNARESTIPRRDVVGRVISLLWRGAGSPAVVPPKPLTGSGTSAGTAVTSEKKAPAQPAAGRNWDEALLRPGEEEPGETDPSWLWPNQMKQAELAKQKGDFAEALRLFELSATSADTERTVQEEGLKKQGQDPGDWPAMRRNWCFWQSRANAGDMLCRLHRLKEAGEAYAKAIATLDDLMGQNKVRQNFKPETVREALASCFIKLGDVTAAQSQNTAAAGHYRAAAAVMGGGDKGAGWALDPKGREFGPDMSVSLHEEELVKLVARISGQPNDYSSDDWQRLRDVLGLACAENAVKFRPLLEDKKLLAAHPLSMAALDWSLNGNRKALDFILNSLAKQSVGADCDEPCVLAYVDEWERSAPAVDAHFTQTDGAGGINHGNFWATRQYFFPRNYLRYKHPRLEGAPLPQTPP